LKANASMAFKEVESAKRIISGIEVVRMIKKINY